METKIDKTEIGVCGLRSLVKLMGPFRLVGVEANYLANISRTRQQQQHARKLKKISAIMFLELNAPSIHC